MKLIGNFLRLGVYKEEVYVVHQSSLLLSRDNLKPVVCVCGENLTCQTEITSMGKPLKITKKVCENCGEIN